MSEGTNEVMYEGQPLSAAQIAEIEAMKKAGLWDPEAAALMALITTQSDSPFTTQDVVDLTHKGKPGPAS